MQKPHRSTPRESTKEMVRNIGRELAEIEQARRHCHRNGLAEPRITGIWLAHLLICSSELLQILLIDTARRPRLLVAAPESDLNLPG